MDHTRIRSPLAAKIRLVITVGVAILLCVTWGGCSGFFIDPSISSIYISPSAVTLAVGDHKQLTCTARYSDGSSNTISGDSVGWSSSATSIATVTSPGGEVTGVATGTASVTCSSQGVTSSPCSITVSITNVNSLSITTTQGNANPQSTATISGVPNTLQFYAYANGTTTDDLTQAVAWTSSNTSVATISSGLSSGNGLATSVKTGTTNITATITNTTTNTLVTSNTIMLTVQ